MGRFKIDFNGDGRSSYPFALYVRRRWFGFGYWRRLDFFPTREEAWELYSKVKNLPEYLD